MKPLSFSVIFLFLLLCAKPKELFFKKNEKNQRSASNSSLNLKAPQKTWELVFSDEFNTDGSFDYRKWTYCPRSTAAWSKYLTSASNYASVNGGSLILKMDNDAVAGDNIPYHSGGIQTSMKFSFSYGKVEVRAKFKEGQGAWPAIWMMPEKPVSYGGWPNSGEVDIMEHINYENRVHQTIHNGKVTSADGGSTATHSAAYTQTDFNTYGIVWTPGSVQFYVNGVLQYTYTKDADATSQQWPFDKPFYLILNQSGGAGWPGPINNADLPFTMEVDWVRVYK